MRQNFYHFAISALLYWLVATYAGLILVMPEKIVTVAVFLPPILGLLWGPVAAAGVYVGGIFSAPEIFLIGFEFNDFLQLIFKSLWIFFAGYLPYLILKKLNVDSDEKSPPLNVDTLRKFLIVFFVTFFATSIFKALTATDTELAAVTDWFFEERKATIPIYFLACFANDFVIAVFLDLAWFFF